MENKKTPYFTKLVQLVSGSWLMIAAAFIFAVISSLSTVFTTYFIGKSIDNIIGVNNVNFNTLFSSLAILVVLFICFSLFQWLVAVLANKIAYKTSMNLRVKLFTKLNRLPVSYFDATPHGDIVSRFTNDADNVSDALSLIITSLFTGLTIIISALIVMLKISVNITLIILLVTPFCFIVAYVVAKFSQSTFKSRQAAMGDLTAFISENVGNAKVVKAFGHEDKSMEKFEEINSVLFKSAKNADFAAAVVNPATRFADNVSYMLVGVIGGITAIASGASAGVISTFLIYSSQFAKPFNEISSIMGNIQTAFASLDRIFKTLDETEEIKDAHDAKEIDNVKGNITFDNVSFSYDKQRSLIEGLNINAKAGDLIAIVGPTGAGKTTIVNLLMRFYEIDGGNITVDGTNIKEIKKNSLRKSFGMVLQDTWLFGGSIRDNILYGNPRASEEDMIAAAKSAHAHSFIKHLSNGYDTIITANGGNLSQGQKQLITIARVMLANPSILILDEATSSIDTLTEIRVQKAFRKLMNGRTGFVIAHRLSTITSANLILVLDKGKIVETGTHTQLLKANGFYASLYYSQFE